MATANQAQDAVFAQVVRLTKVIENSGSSSLVQSEALANVALAFRYALGGPQPGTSVVSK